MIIYGHEKNPHTLRDEKIVIVYLGKQMNKEGL